MRGTQIFFIKKAIPGSIRRLRLSKLPLTNDLASALRRLRISTFNDLVGVSLRDFQRVSDKSSALFLELSRLIKVVATGNGGSLSANRVRPNRLRNNRSSSVPHSPKRVADTRIELTPYALDILARRSPAVAQCRSLDSASGPLVASVSYHVNTESETPTSPHKETIFIPQETRGRSLSSFPLSVRLQHVLRLRDLTLVGDLHGRSFSEVSKYRNCGRKTLNELREFVRRIQGTHYSQTKNLQTGVVPEQEPGPVVAARFFVPAELQHLKISPYERCKEHWESGHRGGIRKNLTQASDWRLAARSSITWKPRLRISEARTAIFVDGCFWHGCAKHCRMPQGNSAYWKPKISGNKKRDQLVTRDLRRSGWSVLRIWEHELTPPNRANVIARIRRALIASGIS